MKQSKNPTPVPIEPNHIDPKSRSRMKNAYRNLKRKLQYHYKKTNIFSNGTVKGQWRQEELPRIVKKIITGNPGITSLEIYATEIRWRCELNYLDLFPKKKNNDQNPSKRKDVNTNEN